MKDKPPAEQVAIVTGGGTGIGRAITQALAGAGMTVIIASRRAAVLQQAANEINQALGEEKVFAHSFDIRDQAQTENLVRQVFTSWGAIDLLVNNSGLAVPEIATEITDDGWDTVMDTNLRGVMRLVRLVLPLMQKGDFGDIVNISSQAGKHGYADVPSYCASKFGLLGFAEALRDDIKKSNANIRVFNFCPGLVDVESMRTDQEPRSGFIHVANMAKTILYALSLDRNVVLEDIGIYAR